MGIKDKIGDVAGKVGDAAGNLTGKGDDDKGAAGSDTATKDTAAADTGPDAAEVEDQDPMRIPPPHMHEIDPSGKVSNNYP